MHSMKFPILISSLLLVLVLGCSKDKGCEPVTPQNELPQIEKFINDNSLVGVNSSNGIYYQIINAGFGATPNLNSTLDVTYRGKYLNGEIFEESTNMVTFQLNRVIEGWQIGIPLIKKGGKINLIIPSAYAYGCAGNSPIPPNTVLYFEINLIDVR